MSDTWAALADEYAHYRIGYANELYDTIAEFGLRRGSSILDVGCGTGIAAQPFVSNGFPVTGVDPSPSMLEKAKERLPEATFVEGSAEALPFPNERFDVAISAQTFHWVDRGRALSEIHRVLRPAGIVAIWWKHLMSQEPLKEIREDAFYAIGSEPPASGLTGGFKEFYAFHGFMQQTLRVIPWRRSMKLSEFLGYERSRCSTMTALGDRSGAYFTELETRLHQRFGQGDPTITPAFVHYLYLAKKR